MMDKEPFFDSSPDFKEPNKSDLLAIRPKAAFEWPPDWDLAIRRAQIRKRYIAHHVGG
jgi:hypothetical protein